MKLQRLFIGMVVLLLVLVFEGSAQAAPKGNSGNNAMTAIKLVVDDRLSKETSYEINGTAWVPVAPIAAALGGKVKNSNGKTYVQWGKISVTLTNGSKKATINETGVLLPQVPITIKGKLYLPFKAIGMFGINAVYHAADKRMILTISHKEAILFGYAVDKDGQPVQQGSITFLSQEASSIGYTAKITNGYYRVEVLEGSYLANVLQKDNAPARTVNLSGYAITVKKQDRVFLPVSQPQPDLTINVHYEDGKPVESGTLVIQTGGGEAKVAIYKGQADYSVEEKGQLFFDRIAIDHVNNQQWDVYATYDADPERGHVIVDVTVHPVNVRLQVKQNGVLLNVEGSIMLSGGLQSVGNGSYDYNLVNGEVSLYLPQGSYIWIDYWTMNDTRLHVQVSKKFEVTDVKAPVVVIADILGSKVQGVLQSSDGSPMKGGILFFSLKSDPKHANVGLAVVDFSNGKYEVILPDGTYTVTYTDSNGQKHAITDYVVTNGKAVSPNLTIQP